MILPLRDARFQGSAAFFKIAQILTPGPLQSRRFKDFHWFATIEIVSSTREIVN